MDKEIHLLINIMIKRYSLDVVISEFCDGIEVIESNDFYECIMRLVESENQREKVLQCKNQFDNIDATIIMPQKVNRAAYILLKNDLGLEFTIRKVIHELIHLVHRCIITRQMKLKDLYEIEENLNYMLFYYLDEFLTKKKEIIIYYDWFHKNQKIVDDNVYINTMAKKFELAKESSLDILDFMRKELFAIAETMAYCNIFSNMFPERFIEDHANISDISVIVSILEKFDSIDVFINNISELERVIDILEKNY